MPSATPENRGALGRLGDVPWHMLATAFYLPLWFTAGNPDLFELRDVVQPGLILLAITCLIAIALRLACGDWRQACLGASASMAFLQCYAIVRLELFADLDPTVARGLAISVVVLGSFMMCALITRLGSRVRNLSLAASIAGVVMIVSPLMTVMANQDVVYSDQRPLQAESQVLLDAASVEPDYPRPTIHHIVLDGYGRADVLHDLYDFDNTGFVGALEAMGFRVLDQTVTPYGQTLMTMNAVFSMNYLNEDIAAIADQSPKQVRQAMHGWFIQSPVRRILERAGYAIVSVEGSYPPLSLRPADRVIAPPHDWTASTLLGRAVYAMTPLGAPIIHGLFGGRADTRESVRFGLADHADDPHARPSFIYRHVLAPHPPFDLNRDGSVRETKATGFPDGDHWSPTLPPEERRRRYRDGYLEKLMYTNDQLLALSRAVIQRTDEPLIIILHGDHGGGMRLAHDDFSKTCAKERFSPFVAVYSSEPELTAALPEDLNLVNLYRALLGKMLGEDIQALEDRSYFAEWNQPTLLERLNAVRRDTYDENCG